MKIKDIGENDRPREKLKANGAQSLSCAELTAILLRTGSGRYNAVDTARLLLSSAGDSLVRLSSMSMKQMCKTCGIGPDKAATITAAFELGRRFACEKAGPDRIPVTNPRMICDMMLPFLKGLSHEECWILYLNRANYVISKEKLSSGGICGTVFDIKMIMRKALEAVASGIIIVHNHPSGNPYPGAHDLRSTESLKKAAELFDISLIDHIIISNDCFYSFTEESAYTV